MLPIGVLQQLAFQRWSPLWRQAHTGNAALALRERQCHRRHLDDVAAAMGIEQIGTAEVMGECLAVVAITNRAIDRARRHVGDHAADLSTAALKCRAIGHRHQRLGITTCRRITTKLAEGKAAFNLPVARFPR
jgi:hypothetical protein